MPERITTSTSRRSRRDSIRTLLPWAALVLALVLLVPMATFFVGSGRLRDRILPAIPSTTASTEETAAPAFDLGRQYGLEWLFSLRVGDGPRDIAVRLDAAETPSTIDVVTAAQDGSVWVVDRPEEIAPGARVRRFSASGRLLASFNAPVGATLFTPGRLGDLWVDLPMGRDKRETVVRYSADGRELKRYVLPPGLAARLLEITPAGECFALAEQWLIDPDKNISVYQGALVPVAAGEDLVPPADPKASSIDASFFGADGRAYRISARISLKDASAQPAFKVEAFDQSGKVLARYSLPTGLRPFAADEKGRVLAEELIPRAPSETVGEASVGDTAGETTWLHVFEPTGEVARIPLQRPAYFTAWPPVATLAADGALVTSTWDERGLSVARLAPGKVAERVRGEKPSRDAELTLVTPSEPPLGDPYRVGDPLQQDIMRLVYAGLVTRDDKGHAVPDLAESVPQPGRGVSTDGLTVRYRLREGLRWHDGEPVTARDVVATWQYLRRPTLSPRSKPFPGFDSIVSVSADGHDVVVRLRERFGAAPEALFPYVLPAHRLGGATGLANPALWAAPVGCGPYRLASWERGKAWRMAAHDGGAQGRPAIRRLDVRFADGRAAADIAFGARNALLWQRVPDDLAYEMTRDLPDQVRPVATGRWWGLVFNPGDAVLRQPAMRFAALRAYRADEMSAAVLPSDVASLAASPFAAVALPALASPDGDTAAAKRAFLDAGCSTDASGNLTFRGEKLGLEIAVTRRNGRNETPPEQAFGLEAAWREAGVTAERHLSKHRMYAGWWRGGSLARGRYQVASVVLPGTVDPAWGSVFDPADAPGPANPRGLGIAASDDRQLAALHEQARRETSSAARVRLGTRIAQRVGELGLAYFERPETRRVAVRRLDGYRPGAYPAGDCWNAGSWRLQEERR